MMDDQIRMQQIFRCMVYLDLWGVYMAHILNFASEVARPRDAHRFRSRAATESKPHGLPSSTQDCYLHCNFDMQVSHSQKAMMCLLTELRTMTRSQGHLLSHLSGGDPF
jgi:hypothetical protein